MRYRLQWYRGPSAVIDVQQQGDTFFLRYDGPFRLTLRRGLEELQITPDDLDGPVGALRRIAGSTGMAGARGGGPPLGAGGGRGVGAGLTPERGTQADRDGGREGTSEGEHLGTVRAEDVQPDGAGGGAHAHVAAGDRLGGEVLR